MTLKLWTTVRKTNVVDYVSWRRSAGAQGRRVHRVHVNKFATLGMATYLVRSMYLRTLDFCTHIMVRNQLIYKCHRVGMDHSSRMHRLRCFAIPIRTISIYWLTITRFWFSGTYSCYFFARNFCLIARWITALKYSIQIRLQQANDEQIIWNCIISSHLYRFWTHYPNGSSMWNACCVKVHL